MGKEYWLTILDRQLGKDQLGLRQHLGDIRILGIYAQKLYYEGEVTKEFPKGLPEELREYWSVVIEHIASCDICQYDVSNIIAALKTEDEARNEYLGIAFDTKEPQTNP